MKSQKGFSLPEIMVAMGIMGAISLVTMKLIEMQRGNEVFLKANTEVSKAINILQSAINNPKSCSDMFGGKLKPATTDPRVAPGTIIPKLEFNFVEQGTGLTKQQTILEHDKNYGAFYLRTNDIQLVSNPTFTAGADTATGTYTSGVVADVYINFRIKQKSINLWGNSTTEFAKDKVIVKRIPIVVTLNKATQAVYSCGPVVSENNVSAREKFCRSLEGGGVAMWNATDKKCVLRSMDCEWGKIPKSMNRMGINTATECQPIENVMPADQIFNKDFTCQIKAGGIALVSDGNGRFRVHCP